VRARAPPLSVRPTRTRREARGYIDDRAVAAGRTAEGARDRPRASLARAACCDCAVVDAAAPSVAPTPLAARVALPGLPPALLLLGLRPGLRPGLRLARAVAPGSARVSVGVDGGSPSSPSSRARRRDVGAPLLAASAAAASPESFHSWSVHHHWPNQYAADFPWSSIGSSPSALQQADAKVANFHFT